VGRLTKTILFGLCLVLLACQSNAMKIHIRFNEAQGLVKGDRVLADGKQIGKVSDIQYTSEGNFLVDILVPEQFRGNLVEGARFYIVNDPDEAGKRAVEVVRSGASSDLLADGAVVDGSDKIQDMVGDLVAGMRERLDELENQLQELLGKVKETPKKEEIKRLREELERLAREMKKASQAAKEKLNKEVLPRLEQELERLKKRLKELGREKEVEPLETQLKELKKI